MSTLPPDGANGGEDDPNAAVPGGPGSGGSGGSDSGNSGGFSGTNLIDQPIENELRDSYLTYAMSVIVSRALPDVRDGLKPSQRRILVAMNDLSLTRGLSALSALRSLVTPAVTITRTVKR